MKKIDVIQRWDEKDTDTIEWDITVDGEVLKTYAYKEVRYAPTRTSGFIDALKVIYGEDNVECSMEYK